MLRRRHAVTTSRAAPDSSNETDKAARLWSENKRAPTHPPSIRVYYLESMTPPGNPLWFMAAAPVSRYKTGRRPTPPPQTADLAPLLVVH
jgi:hypothetical protein